VNQPRGSHRVRNALLFVLLGLEALGAVVALGVALASTSVSTVPGVAMEKTIAHGDKVLVVKGDEVRRGDVVTLSASEWGSPGRVYLYRVIGVGGDRVTGDAQGHLTVDGRVLKEDYVAPSRGANAQPFNVQVPSGRIWVMGDNRDLAADSRVHRGDPGGGTLEARSVRGRVIATGAGSTWHRITSPSRNGMPGVLVALLAGLVFAVLFLISVPVVLVIVLRGQNGQKRSRTPGVPGVI
jgi:signal peptidase I